MRFSAASATLVALLALAGCSRDPVGDRPDYVATASGRLDARVEARFLELLVPHSCHTFASAADESMKCL